MNNREFELTVLKYKNADAPPIPADLEYILKSIATGIALKHSEDLLEQGAIVCTIGQLCRMAWRGGHDEGKNCRLEVAFNDALKGIGEQFMIGFDLTLKRSDEKGK